MKYIKRPDRCFILEMLLLVAVLCACSTTYEAKHVQTSGFLGDYFQLKKVDRASLLYINDAVDFDKYKRIVIDPVRMYAATNGKLAKLPKADQQRLVNYLDASLRAYLTNRYTLVSQPGPGVMRVRMAITAAKGANVPMDVVSTLLPIGLAISALKEMATGVHSAVGEAGLECEALDSETGQRLFAFVDVRVGRKVTGRFDKLKKWHTAQDAFDFWAKEISGYLQEKQSAKDQLDKAKPRS